LTIAAFTYQPTQIPAYDAAIEKEIEQLSEVIAQTPGLATVYPPRWLAIQLLEQDDSLIAEVRAICGSARVLPTLEQSISRLSTVYGDDLDIILADHRYTFINQLVQSVQQRPSIQAINLSDQIDKIVTHRWLGIPIFLGLMWAVFKLTTDVAAPYVDWVDGVISGPITNWASSLMQLLGLGSRWPESLLLDGIIAGVGGVVVFIPVLMILYLALAILEDSGYMARAAFVMDRVMQKIGLHGKSFLPMVVGFGCSVPGIYATRTLENERDRILTGLLVPYMSCGARLPVYVLFATIFFPDQMGLVIFGLYLAGILTAILLGLILRQTLFRGHEETLLLIELPPYRRPNLKTVWFYVWERTSAFIENAWSLILITSIVIWFLMAIPVSGTGSFANTEVEDSAFGVVSGTIAPVFTPLGFGSWEATGALISGFVAKEVVVSTTALVYNVPEADEPETSSSFFKDVGTIASSFLVATIDTVKSIPLIFGINLFETADEPPEGGLMDAIRAGFNVSSGGHGALAALAFMAFVLLYTPCMVAISAMRQELGLKWTWFSIISQLVVAWVAAFMIFQGGLLLMSGGS
jgi:ferrous iron transport protein B